MREKQKLVPKLRFPEFREAGEWEEGKLISLSNEPLSNGVFNDPKKVGVGYKLINVSDMYIDTAIDEGRLSLLELAQSDFEANQVEHGDIFFTRSSLVKSGIAVSNIYLGSSSDVTFDGHLIRFRANTNKVVPLFAHYLFKTTPIRAQLVARGKSATMTTIGQADVASVMLFSPEKKEQQKIADCLTSLDELITLEAQKLDTLQTHKKGLMQQLFPAEGETLPKLRFPEFRDGGEWEEKTLGEIVEVASGLVDPTEPPYCNMPHIGGENIESHTGNLQGVRTSKELGLISGKYLFDERDVLYSKIRPALNKVAIPDFQGICSADIYPLRPSNQKLCRQYLAYLLLSEDFLEYATKHSDRSKIPKVNRDSLLTYELVIPRRPEQQKIADCLISHDDLITAQTQQLAELKTHKQGLMQQLFPVLDEVAA